MSQAEGNRHVQRKVCEISLHYDIARRGALELARDDGNGKSRGAARGRGGACGGGPGGEGGGGPGTACTGLSAVRRHPPGSDAL